MTSTTDHDFEPSPSWESATPLTELPAGPLYVGLQCQKMPINSCIGFSVVDREGTTLCHVPKTRILHSDMTLIHPIEWHLQMSAMLQMRVWFGAASPSPYASVAPLLLQSLQHRLHHGGLRFEDNTWRR
jgi:hypothetical protein